jgi:KRAB domain-containing zinc finger protein
LQEFVSKRTLESHLQGHKRNNCSYCDKVLTRRVQLIRHLLEVHAIKLERDTYKCDHCEKRFANCNTKNSLLYNCCCRYIKKCSLFYHLRQHLPDKCVCLECGQISDSIEEYEAHKKQHDLQKHFNCSKCGDKFSRRQQYLYHLKVHSN